VAAARIELRSTSLDADESAGDYSPALLELRKISSDRMLRTAEADE
jgi:hypothetical protein